MDERTSREAVAGPSNAGIAQVCALPSVLSCIRLPCMVIYSETPTEIPPMQVMGNSEQTWKRYYNLKAATRDGQDALDDMHKWRDGMEALMLSNARDAVAALSVVIIPDSEDEEEGGDEDSGNDSDVEEIENPF